MSSIVLSGDTSGTVTVTVPAVAGTNTATLPAATGTVMVSGNMPAFSAYGTGGQSFSSTVFTKVQVNTEEFDTANAFDSTTNYRFTPLVAGYYQINGQISCTTTISIIRTICAIYKNGASYKLGNDFGTPFRSTVSCIVYLNGSTDYVEMFAYLSGTGTLSTTSSTGPDNFFQAAMIRSA